MFHKGGGAIRGGDLLQNITWLLKGGGAVISKGAYYKNRLPNLGGGGLLESEVHNREGTVN